MTPDAPTIPAASWEALALACWPLWFALAAVALLALLGTPRGGTDER